ncbi:MAG: TlpA family protein disulfide reductase [Flavobacteriales bacterium]
MKSFYYFIVIALTIFSCKKDKDNFAFIGGEITNPYTDFVVISKADSVLDTISLDKNNRFIYKINNLISGIYTFKHGREVQMVLLEPNDSIMFRLNTLDFDESLAFTGIGDKKNNYLINGFLQNEIEQKRIFKFCQLSAKHYQNQIDSLKAEKDLKLKIFTKKHNPSDLFIKIAKANIDYNYYASKEIYPFIHIGDNKRAILNALPDDFYDYRKDIDYNNDYNRDFFNYNSFLRSTFNNIALKNHLDRSESDHFNTNALDYNLEILHVVDSIISNPKIKNELLFYYTITYLTKNNSSEDNNEMLQSYLSKSTDAENKKDLSLIAQSINNLKAGNDFPNIELVDFKNNELNISSLVNKPTVIYFWSHKFNNHFRDSHYKTNELSIKYPEISFISINVDDSGTNFCKNSMDENKFSCDKEFQFKNPKQTRLSLAIYPITKTIILDKNNKIVNSNTNIFNANFEEQLLGLINR